MQNRLLNIVALTAIVYSVWSGLGVWLAHSPTLLSVLANVLMGALLGILFTFLNETADARLRLPDLVLQAVMGALMFGIFAVLQVRAFAWDVIAVWAAGGVLFGAVMWALGGVYLGICGRARWQNALGVLLGIAGLVVAPALAGRFFAGALFVVVAVGVRVFAGVTITRLPLRQQAFIFGTAVGIALVAVPGIGYFAYGAV
jgi:hypothetical protein